MEDVRDGRALSNNLLHSLHDGTECYKPVAPFIKRFLAKLWRNVADVVVIIFDRWREILYDIGGTFFIVLVK